MLGQPVVQSALETSRKVAELVFGPREARPFAIRYWDSGFVEAPTVVDPPFTIVLSHPGALRCLLLPPSELQMAEAVLHGDVEIEGDLEAATRLAPEIRNRLASPRAIGQLFRLLLALPMHNAQRTDARRLHGWLGRFRLHSQERDAAAVRSHYDLSNEFYQLWLDRNMVYSCGYFEHAGDDLDTAQLAKLEHICRKLRLQPGERLLDIGCGWGALICYAAKQYGVTALGVTLSEEQARVARERIAAEGLADRCVVEVRDYRTLGEVPPFDKVVSVGMAEHVGRSELSTYFGMAYQLTKPGGLFLLHCIAEGRRPKPGFSLTPWREGKFTDEYVFPDGDLVPLFHLEEEAYHTGYETLDVESLREHYALTLRAWTRRLEAARDTAIDLVGLTNYRIWRLNMAGAAENFANGKHALVQLLLARPAERGAVPGLPLTRRDLYQPPHADEQDQIIPDSLSEEYSVSRWVPDRDEDGA